MVENMSWAPSIEGTEENGETPMEVTTISMTRELATNLVGGYTYEFVDYQRSESEEVLCLICLHVARDPHRGSCCHKIFCKDCLEKHYLHKHPERPCPYCRAASCTHAPCPVTTSTIQSLHIHCTNSEHGCLWKGELQLIHTHLKKKCIAALVECKDCKQKVSRKQRQYHLLHECPKRNFECKYCKKQDSYENIMTHINEECPQCTITCENCHKPIKRNDIEEHCKLCPKNSIPCCHSHIIDCRQFVVREKMSDHERSSYNDHLELAVKKVHELKEQLHKYDEVKDSLMYRVPITYKISNFTQFQTNSRVWESPPFFTHPRGYKLCLKVYTNGAETGHKSHISVYIMLMAGPFDDDLKWPFICHFTLALLNQEKDCNHIIKNKDFVNDHMEKYNMRVVNGKKYADVGIGIPQFAAHSCLTSGHYLVNDCVYLSVRCARVCSTPKAWLATVERPSCQ